MVSQEFGKIVNGKLKRLVDTKLGNFGNLNERLQSKSENVVNRAVERVMRKKKTKGKGEKYKENSSNFSIKESDRILASRINAAEVAKGQDLIDRLILNS